MVTFVLAAAFTAERAVAAPQMQLQLREQTADQQVNHVFSRLAFGARPGDVEKVRAMGVDAWIESQLNPEKIDDRSTDQFVRLSYPTLSMSAAEVVAAFPRPQQAPARAAAMGGADSARNAAMLQQQQQQQRAMNARLNQEMPSAQLARAVMSERQLYEVMVQFWENHFSVFQNKGQVRYYLTDYDRAIRQHAMGDFRELLGVVARSPAMLFYLDNHQSVADANRRTTIHMMCGLPPTAVVRPQDGRGRGVGAGSADPCAGAQLGRGRLLPPANQQRRATGLNENYARELMELHTMGVDGGYTQQDIIEVARALTGWGIQNPQQNPVFAFRPESHDAEAKTVLGQRFPAGRGIEDGEMVLDLVASHPSTARFIATKLARRFVADSPSVALVERAAETFTRTRGNIRETLRTIVTSPEFFSADAYRSKVKTPFELVASTMRAVNSLPDPTIRSAQFVTQLGQPLFGKETPNGYPDVADQWMSTGAILNRINYGTAVAAGGTGLTLDRWPAAAALRNAPRAEQVDGVIAALLAGSVSADTRAILMGGENPFLAANAGAVTDSTMMTGNMQPPPAGRAGRAGRAARAGQPPQAGALAGRGRAAGNLARGPVVNLEGLPQVIGLALGSPEFQRR
jgi:uncharacterized protein (DUF1800 family)